MRLSGGPHFAEVPHAMVASEDALASRVGQETLRAGGNAIDAAVATALALAVTHPEAGNLGGGSFMLYRRARDGFATVIDCREMAPAAAHRDLFLDKNGQADADRAQVGHLATGVPGAVAGLHLGWSRYGRLPWASLVAPAVQVARDGFALNGDFARDLLEERAKLERFPHTRALFFPGGRPLAEGDMLVQPDLARTLQHVAESGPAGFYEGSVADLVVEEMRRGGGLVTREDLGAYRAVEREPIRGSYRGLDVLGAPPPSSGGVTLLQMLGMLEAHDLRSLGRRSALEIHLVSEAMRRAFADRNTYLGDPDFVPAPVAPLLSPEYLARRRGDISLERATPSTLVAPGDFAARRAGGETTHLSVVDAVGDAVALTTTLNSKFGSGVLVPGAGFLLNNTMDDFAAKPGALNQFELVESEANAIAPGKRMLSSMAPTIVLRGGRPWLVLGSRGGPRIITTVLTILIDVIDHGVGLEEAVQARRYHHQWQPDEIWHEPGAFGPELRAQLQAMGHRLRKHVTYGSPQCIEIAPDGTRRGASDPRTQGAALGC
jgi:gamma-glutamyltranspeptidase/glutathione hydrolase